MPEHVVESYRRWDGRGFILGDDGEIYGWQCVTDGCDAQGEAFETELEAWTDSKKHGTPKPLIFGFVQTIYGGDRTTFAGGRHDNLGVLAMAEDGCVLASHISSSELWAIHDLGFAGSTWKHDAYNEHYPDGWQCVWLSIDPMDDERFRAAYVHNQRLKEQDDAARAARRPTSPADATAGGTSADV